MCLAVPAQVISIDKDAGLARVSSFGNEREVDVNLIPEVKVGDFVLIHAGFAIQVIDEDEARKSLEVWKEIADGGRAVQGV